MKKNNTNIIYLAELINKNNNKSIEIFDKTKTRIDSIDYNFNNRNMIISYLSSNLDNIKKEENKFLLLFLLSFILSAGIIATSILFMNSIFIKLLSFFLLVGPTSLFSIIFFKLFKSFYKSFTSTKRNLLINETSDDIETTYKAIIQNKYIRNRNVNSPDKKIVDIKEIYDCFEPNVLAPVQKNKAKILTLKK